MAGDQGGRRVKDGVGMVVVLEVHMFHACGVQAVRYTTNEGVFWGGVREQKSSTLSGLDRTTKLPHIITT